MDQLVSISRRKLWKGLFASRIPRSVHDLLKGVDIHEFAFSYQRSVFSFGLDFIG